MLARDSVKKESHLGMAGHYAAMAEFLRRGYNVAIPAVDVGDDIIVIEDTEGLIRRVQVKTATLAGAGSLSFSGINFAAVGTFFMLTAWIDERWSYLFLRREDLFRQRRFAAERPRTRPGAPMKLEAPVVTIAARVERAAGEVSFSFWGQRFVANRWLAEDFPELAQGPGSRARTPSPAES